MTIPRRLSNPWKNERPTTACESMVEMVIATIAAITTGNSPVNSNAIRMVEMGAPITGAATAPMPTIA